MMRPDEINVRNLRELRALIRRQHRLAGFFPMTGASQQDVSDIETRLGTPASGTIASQLGSDADAAAQGGSVHAKIKELRALVATLSDIAFLLDTDVAALPVAGSMADLLRSLEKRAADASVVNSIAHRLANISVTFAGATYFAVSATTAAGIVLDSGPLAAGNYEVLAFCLLRSTNGTLGAAHLQHRDAANTGNVKTIEIFSMTGSTYGSGSLMHWPKVSVALNERFRLENDNAPAAGQAGWMLFVRTA